MSKKQLKFTLIEGKDLKVMDLLGTADPYVQLILSGQEKKSKVKALTLDPTWNETFTFDVSDESAILRGHVLNYSLLDIKYELGHFIIPLSTLFEGESERWIRLQETHQGLIHFKIEAIGFGKTLENSKIENTYTSFTKIYESLSLPAEELNYVNFRKENQVLESLKKFLGKKELNKVPVIALCASGGGMRACTGTCGSVEGLVDAGLFPALSYISGLSGSTWFITPFYEYGCSFSKFKDILRKSLKVGITGLTTEEIIACSSATTARWGYKEISTVDFFGTMLANVYLFAKGIDKKYNHFQTSFSQLKYGEFMANFKAPLPILNTILIRDGIEEKDFFKWFEFTPFLAGFTSYKSFVPTEMFGCSFNKGMMVSSKYPQDDLGYIMGICGSAFQISMKYVINAIKNDYKDLSKYLDETLSDVEKGSRLDPPAISNFCLGTLNDLSKDKTFSLVDAGIMVNIPIGPLLRPERKVDIIIVCDYSGELTNAPSLKSAEKLAKDDGYAFPKVDYKGIEKKPFSVWRGKDAPTIIYLPLLHVDGYFLDKKVDKDFPNYGTFKLQYDEDDFDTLTDLCRYNMKSAIPSIKKEILRVINDGEEEEDGIDE